MLICERTQAAEPQPGYRINSVHVSKEEEPGKTFRSAHRRRVALAAAGAADKMQLEGGQVELLDDKTLASKGSCELHAQHIPRRIPRHSSIHSTRTRGFLWKLNHGVVNFDVVRRIYNAQIKGA